MLFPPPRLSRRASVPVRLLGVCWLPPEIKHSFWLPFSTWRESQAALRSECSRPPPTLPLLSPITDRDSGKDKKPETIKFKIATGGGGEKKQRGNN